MTTSHDRSTPSQSSTVSAFIDAAADRVARLLAETQRDAQRERDLREAQFAAKMAELETRIASVAQIEERLGERLASLKDGEPGRDGRDGDDAISPTPEAIADLIRGDVTRDATAAALAEVASWDRPQDGKSVTVEDVEPLVRTLVEDAVKEIPAGKDGKDADHDLVRQIVEEAVAAIPVPRDGVDGKDGEPGAPGPMGKLPTVSKWEDRVHYQGEVVSFDGALYQASKDTGKSPAHEDWTCVVSPGRNGADGKSFTIRGTWEPGIEYNELDVVMINGASFAAKSDNPGECPGDGWQLMAAQGKRGKPGERGPNGVGLRGLPGASVKQLRVNDNGVLRLVNADGSEVECDLYPLLSKIGG